MILFALVFVMLAVYISAGFLVGLLSLPMLGMLLIGVVSLIAFVRYEGSIPYLLIISPYSGYGPLPSARQMPSSMRSQGER
jgi:hypothetical protein